MTVIMFKYIDIDGMMSVSLCKLAGWLQCFCFKLTKSDRLLLCVLTYTTSILWVYENMSAVWTEKGQVSAIRDIPHILIGRELNQINLADLILHWAQLNPGGGRT